MTTFARFYLVVIPTNLTLLYFLAGAVALYAEYATLGQISPQGWEFYAVTACLFLVFSFPGFVYKVLWH